jgi:hypothetical protein
LVVQERRGIERQQHRDRAGGNLRQDFPGRAVQPRESIWRRIKARDLGARRVPVNGGERNARRRHLDFRRGFGRGGCVLRRGGRSQSENGEEQKLRRAAHGRH